MAALVRPRRRAVARLLVAASLPVVLLAGCTTPTTTPSPAVRSTAAPSAAPDDHRLRAGLARLEDRYRARLGVAVLDTGSGRRLAYRSTERFAFASTNKTFIAAVTLRSATERDLATVVDYAASDLVAHAPVTSEHVGTGMTVRALLDAMLRFSDNTAANLLVERLGGPQAVERFLRSIGDTTTSVDRTEPQLNSAVPGDRRDTTTPATYAADLETVLLGSALPAPRRELLERLMTASTTGGPYIRAGVPSSWLVADRSGSGAHGVRNDIAVVRPPGRAPILIVLLSSGRTADAIPGDGLLADATRVVVRAVER